MKKLLGLLGAAGLVATTSATVVACGNKASDVTLSETNLSKEFSVKTSKITADGTITFKLAKDSVLNVEVKAGSQKAGEVIIVVSTTADKVKDKEVKETVDVIHKVKDSTKSEETVSSVSVKIEAKKASTGKIKLDTADFKLTATNSTTNAEVIAALKKFKGLEKVVEKIDVKITKTNATLSAKGSIKIEAVGTSTLVEASKTFEIDQLVKVDLSTVKNLLTPTNDTTVDEVIRALKTVKGLEEVALTTDVKITKINAGTSLDGSIVIEAVVTSTLVSGKLDLVIARS
ncbi:lipoprotein [Spiroplasma endosymbiont of Atherix ibis]|uniref:lipoprotein n=1 Tax=Spiroplasma endosymbiont of Atherix ibis TaxID=3066291 RepID=UPI0030D30558